MNVVGLDLSLTSTGICWHDDSAHSLKTAQRGIDRLIELRRRIVHGCPDNTDLVAIEGYSFSSKFSHAHALGELGGVVRVALQEIGVKWVDIPPAVLKKYATGKGNASKDQVLVAGVKRSGVEFGNNDECDAWWLRAAALDHYGFSVVPMPAAHRLALGAVEWPELAVAP